MLCIYHVKSRATPKTTIEIRFFLKKLLKNENGILQNVQLREWQEKRKQKQKTIKSKQKIKLLM